MFFVLAFGMYWSRMDGMARHGISGKTGGERERECVCVCVRVTEERENEPYPSVENGRPWCYFVRPFYFIFFPFFSNR
jgi:hypothetical protein